MFGLGFPGMGLGMGMYPGWGGMGLGMGMYPGWGGMGWGAPYASYYYYRRFFGCGCGRRFWY